MYGYYCSQVQTQKGRIEQGIKDMAALDLNNFMLPTSPYLGYARNDINNFIRNCYATNDPTNNINKIMTIEEDEEDDDEETIRKIGEEDVGSTNYFEKRIKRIEDWNKAYNSDDDRVTVGKEVYKSVEENKSETGDDNEKDEAAIGEKKKSTENLKNPNHKYLKVTFADDFGCDLIQNFIIKSSSDDEDDVEDTQKELADDCEEEDDNEASSCGETDDSDKENSSDKTYIKKKKEIDDFESLQMTINKLIGSDINIGEDICFSSGNDIDLGGDVDLGASSCDIDLGGSNDLGLEGGSGDIGGGIENLHIDPSSIEKHQLNEQNTLEDSSPTAIIREIAKN